MVSPSRTETTGPKNSAKDKWGSRKTVKLVRSSRVSGSGVLQLHQTSLYSMWAKAESHLILFDTSRNRRSITGINILPDPVISRA
jgi:hypothetical protein